MPKVEVSANELIRNAELAVKPCTDRLARDDMWLHDHGYHAWSTDLANLRHEIDKAFSSYVGKVLAYDA